MSIFALKGELPDEHLEVRRAFVIACKLLCRTFVTVSDVIKADSLSKTFCVKFERLYGAEHVTPNMHMHTHLCQCVLVVQLLSTKIVHSYDKSMKLCQITNIPKTNIGAKPNSPLDSSTAQDPKWPT